MNTLFSSFRSGAAVFAGALLTIVCGSGCITHPPDATRKTDVSKESITHPPDRSKEGPERVRHHRHHRGQGVPRVGSTPPPNITHPGE